eukprot:scaffold17455_cov18-Tisochrysis_lutea.AAC.1
MTMNASCEGEKEEEGTQGDEELPVYHYILEVFDKSVQAAIVMQVVCVPALPSPRTVLSHACLSDFRLTDFFAFPKQLQRAFRLLKAKCKSGVMPSDGEEKNLLAVKEDDNR